MNFKGARRIDKNRPQNYVNSIMESKRRSFLIRSTLSDWPFKVSVMSVLPLSQVKVCVPHIYMLILRFYTVKPVYSGHLRFLIKVSAITRCPLHRGSTFFRIKVILLKFWLGLLNFTVFLVYVRHMEMFEGNINKKDSDINKNKNTCRKF